MSRHASSTRHCRFRTPPPPWSSRTPQLQLINRWRPTLTIGVPGLDDGLRADLLSSLVPGHRDRRARLRDAPVGPVAGGRLRRGRTDLARVLHGDEHAALVLRDQRAAGLRTDGDGEELAEVAALTTAHRH